jgi:hypothetical protein
MALRASKEDEKQSFIDFYSTSRRFSEELKAQCNQKAKLVDRLTGEASSPLR